MYLPTLSNKTSQSLVILGRETLLFIWNLNLLLVRCDWWIPGGEEAPDKWAWRAPANQRAPGTTATAEAAEGATLTPSSNLLFIYYIIYFIIFLWGRLD